MVASNITTQPKQGRQALSLSSLSILFCQWLQFIVFNKPTLSLITVSLGIDVYGCVCKESATKTIIPNRACLKCTLVRAGNPHTRERIRTVDLLVLTSREQQLFILKLYFLFHKTTYLKEEVSCIEPSPSVRAPWLGWAGSEVKSDHESWIWN